MEINSAKTLRCRIIQRSINYCFNSSDNLDLGQPQSLETTFSCSLNANEEKSKFIYRETLVYYTMVIVAVYVHCRGF